VPGEEDGWGIVPDPKITSHTDPWIDPGDGVIYNQPSARVAYFVRSPSNKVTSWEGEVWLAVLGLTNQYITLKELGGRD